MALSKKPVKGTVDVEALILKGGSVPPTRQTRSANLPGEGEDSDGGKKVPVQLRLSPEIIGEIDALIGKRVIKVSRHAWFMEALAEKITKERGLG